MWRYAIFRAGVDDLNFHAGHQRHVYWIFRHVGRSVNHLLVHFSPILVVGFPFVRSLNGAPGLVLLQSLLIAATIIPLWGLAVTRFPKWLAFATTLIAATYPPLSAEAVGDFHELAFTPPLAATLVWAIDRRSWRVAIAEQPY